MNTNKSSETMAHTPEPWKAGRTDMRSYLGDGSAVHYVYRSENENANTRVRFVTNPDSESDPTADALRVVACVNALAGVSDPLAFRKAVEELTKACEENVAAFNNYRNARFDPADHAEIRRINAINTLESSLEQLAKMLGKE